MTRIAYLGPEGTFTEAALGEMSRRDWCPGEPTSNRSRRRSPPAALQMVRDLDADYACVPIENSIEGSVLPTLDSLANGTPVQIFAELTLDMAFTIAVRPGTSTLRRWPRFRWRLPRWRGWAAENLPDASGSRRPTPTPRPPYDVAEGAPTPP